MARIGSVKQAISYCGLCAAERSSAEVVKRIPISKQRNKHLQSVLVEAAKLGRRLSHELAMVYEAEKHVGKPRLTPRARTGHRPNNRNRGTARLRRG